MSHQCTLYLHDDGLMLSTLENMLQGVTEFDATATRVGHGFADPHIMTIVVLINPGSRSHIRHVIWLSLRADAKVGVDERVSLRREKKCGWCNFKDLMTKTCKSVKN